MRCNDFDAHIDEMLSGILHPDANQHMTHCERCTSHYRARATVQTGLRKLAAAAPSGPSRATDRAVMQAYRELQHRRLATQPSESHGLKLVPATRPFTFASASFAPVWASRTWLSGAAAAAVVFAVLGSAVHLWNGTPVGAPTIATAPTAVHSAANAVTHSAANVQVASAARAKSPKSSPAASTTAQSEVAAAAAPPSEQVTAKARPVRRFTPYGESSNYESTPVTQVASDAAPVIRLASTGTANGAANNVAQSASSTWPGYSNLMYCDPVVCSGPMQVVHIKVPVGQVKPNLGQTVGNAFVNAEVVVGPDGVARAIRVAN